MPCKDPQSKYPCFVVSVIAVVLVKRVLDTDRYDGAVYIVLILMALLVVMIGQGSAQYGVREDTGWFFLSGETSRQSVGPAVEYRIVTEHGNNRTTIEIETTRAFTASEGMSELWFHTSVVCSAEYGDCQVFSTEEASLESASANKSWFSGAYYDRLTYRAIEVVSSSQSLVMNTAHATECRLELGWKIVLLYPYAERHDDRYYANVSFEIQHPDILEPEAQSMAVYAGIFLTATAAILVTAYGVSSALHGMTARRAACPDTSDATWRWF